MEAVLYTILEQTHNNNKKKLFVGSIPWGLSGVFLLINVHKPKHPRIW